VATGCGGVLDEVGDGECWGLVCPSSVREGALVRVRRSGGLGLGFDEGAVEHCQARRSLTG
jgi:hypothetical protein